MNTLNLFGHTKYVLFDFDDTLCIHTSHKPWTTEMSHELEVRMLVGGNPYNASFANPHMAEFIDMCKRCDIKMGLISHVNSVPEAKAKEKWVEDWYNVKLENFCVGTREQKLEMLKRISDSKCIDREDILIVDDAYLTLTEAEGAGFQTATPMEIVNFIQPNRCSIRKNRKTFRIRKPKHDAASYYDPNFGDNKLCICGHAYERHFDLYDGHEIAGCKYCGCSHFVEKRRMEMKLPDYIANAVGDKIKPSVETINVNENTFEIVDAIPNGYLIWNIGDHMLDGYIPLCRLKSAQDFDGGKNIETNTLKAVRCREAKFVLKAVAHSLNTLPRMRQYVRLNKNKTSEKIRYYVDICETAIAALEKIEGTENLLK